MDTSGGRGTGGISGIANICPETMEKFYDLARENPRWGYGKIQGEIIKLSFKVSQSTVRNILNRHGIQPMPVRNGSIRWRHLMTHYKDQILECHQVENRESSDNNIADIQ